MPPDAEALGAERVARIEAALRAALDPLELRVEDESHLHRGHAGAKSGGGHFRVHIVARAFEGRSRLARHRLLYAALGDEMKSEIHALAIHATAPGEADPLP